MSHHNNSNIFSLILFSFFSFLFFTSFIFFFTIWYSYNFINEYYSALNERGEGQGLARNNFILYWKWIVNNWMRNMWNGQIMTRQQTCYWCRPASLHSPWPPGCWRWTRTWGSSYWWGSTWTGCHTSLLLNFWTITWLAFWNYLNYFWNLPSSTILKKVEV